MLVINAFAFAIYAYLTLDLARKRMSSKELDIPNLIFEGFFAFSAGFLGADVFFNIIF